MEYIEDVTALVVDDSDFFASLAADKVETAHGIQTTTASSARAALATLEETTVDCIVSDYDMPETNGLEFYRELQEEYSSLPFILLTGRTDGDIASTAISEGVDEFIRKESVSEENDFEVLANRIRNVVSRRKARQKYELLVDNTPESIAQVRRDGTILASNDSMAATYDASPGELVGESVRDVLPSDVASQWLAYSDDALTRDEQVNFESSYDGRHYHTLVVPVDVGGELDSVQVISRDITDRVEDEQELERTTEQLELVNRLVRHDIRNDVNLVSMWARTVGDAVEDPELTEYVEKIRSASEHIEELTTIAGEFVDAVSGTDGVSTEPVALRGVLLEELEKCRSRYGDAQFIVNGEIPAATVSANGMLSSVFRNLLNNAVQHNDSETPEVRLLVAVDDDTATVTIADNGPGVPPDQREEIFGKGKQGPESAGSGIGLYLVHTLVSGYGGSVHVEASHLGGAAFVVELPLAE